MITEKEISELLKPDNTDLNNLNVDLQIVGYEVSTGSEELGWQEKYFRTREETNMYIEKLKEKCKKMLVQRKDDIVHIRTLYIDKNNILTPKQDLTKDLEELYTIQNANIEEIKVEFSNKSQKIGKMFDNKLKPIKTISPLAYMDDEINIFKIKDDYFVSYGNLYKVENDIEDILEIER